MSYLFVYHIKFLKYEGISTCRHVLTQYNMSHTGGLLSFPIHKAILHKKKKKKRKSKQKLNINIKYNTTQHILSGLIRSDTLFHKFHFPSFRLSCPLTKTCDTLPHILPNQTWRQFVIWSSKWNHMSVVSNLKYTKLKGRFSCFLGF